MKRGYDRIHRIADVIQKTLANLLIQDMADERFRFVTVTGVNVARDMSFAKVYVSVLTEKDEEVEKTVAALNHANKSIRYNLAHKVDLRVVPALKFVYDSSTAYGFHINHLLDKTKISDQ